MTSLLSELALDKEDFSSLQGAEETPIGRDEDIHLRKEKEKYEELELKHHETVGEVRVLKDTIESLREDNDELKKQLERQREQVSIEEMENCNTELREECEKYSETLHNLQACHTDLERALEESNSRVGLLQGEKKNLQKHLQSKDEMVAKLEKELCEVEKWKSSRVESDIASGSGESAQENKDKVRNEEPEKDLSLEEQVEDLKDCARRTSSRLSYLNTRLTAKDEMIVKLQNRIEEVITERDSFREALQMSFVSPCASSSLVRSSSDPVANSMQSEPMLDNEKSELVSKDHIAESSSPTRPSNQDLSMGESEMKSSPPSSSTKASAGPASSVLGNWQNAVAVTSVTDSLKGVTSSLGSYLLAPTGGSGGMSEGLNHHQKTYMNNLEKKVQVLQQKNKKLSDLKSLIPVVEELKEKMATTEAAAKETDKWAEEEFELLTKKVDELRELRKEALNKYQQSQEEVENLQKQISRTENTYSNFEERLKEKTRHIQILEKEIRTTKENSVPMTTHDQLEDRVSTLVGESKHWQKKAQSLSKEMHRAMSLQIDFNKKKDDITILEKKIEELEEERLGFKKAMQDIMLHQSNSDVNSGIPEEESQNPSPLKSWFGV